MDVRSWAMGLGFAIMWSSAFSSARIIVANASPFGALSIRFLISGIIGVLIAKWLGQSFKLTKAQWKATIIFGICQNTLYLGLNFFAMQTVEASLASIIASSCRNRPRSPSKRARFRSTAKRSISSFGTDITKR